MAKQSNQTNHRVVVDVDFNQFFREQKDREASAMRNAEDLVDQIKRHCDGWVNVNVEWDVESTCTHCGYTWDEDEDGLPLCCGVAQDEFTAHDDQERTE